MDTHGDEVQGGVPVESTFYIGGKEYHGVKDSVAHVLLLDGRPDVGDLWETAEGVYHVRGFRLPQRANDRYVVFMESGLPIA